jgi:hypothetical protein
MFMERKPGGGQDGGLWESQAIEFQAQLFSHRAVTAISTH